MLQQIFFVHEAIKKKKVGKGFPFINRNEKFMKNFNTY